jgi:hippurate hydrolase
MTLTSRYTEIPDLADDAPSLRKLRQHIHQHPELAFEELQTADLVALKLAEWGWQVTRGVGETGVVGR